MQKNSFPVKYCKESAVWRLLPAFDCFCFDRRTRIILREFPDRNDLEWEIYLYDIYYFVASLT